jgi:hypothetical protein
MMFALAGSLPARQRHVLAGTFAAMAAVIVAAATHTLLGIGGSRVDAPTEDWASCAVYVLVAGIVVFRALRIAEARAPWVMIAVGISLYGAGNLVWSLWLGNLASPPIPSISDALWLALYPMSYVGIALLARHHWRGIPAGVWLDGIVAGLGIACVGAALVLGPVLEAATGSLSAVATNLSYPIADLVLTALVVGVFSLRGWRLDRTWALLGAGFLVLTVADSIVLLQVAENSSSSSQVANLFYMAGVGMIALAAWQRPGTSDPARTESLSTLLVPGAFALAAVAVLGYDHFVRVGLLSFVLAMLTVLAALLRTALAFRDRRSFNETRRQDVLTQLEALGVSLSLDDFGAGFSSLGHLKTLPVMEIKIDRSFVAQMASNTADSAIVDATIQLAHRLGKRVVAEGVEDHDTWKQLANAGCHLVQGFALSPPLPAAELAPLLVELGVRRAA